MRAILIATLTFASAPALAATLTLSSGRTVSGQGQVTDYFKQAGVVEERFKSVSPTVNPSGCGQTHPGAFALDSVYTDSNAQILSGAQINVALPPGTTRASLDAGIPIADTSCYLATPGPTYVGSVANGFNINVNSRATSPTLYFGFYWGSIDTYNNFQLLSKPDVNGNTTPILVNGISSGDGTITGTSVLTAFGKPAQFNSFITFQFTAAENFGSIVLGTNNRAFELDNLFFSTRPLTPPTPQLTTPAFKANVAPAAVPEPALAMLFALGSGLVALRRRRA